MGILNRSHIKVLLVAYLNGGLPRAERERVARHLAGCDECRRALAAEAQLAAELRARLPALTAPRPGQLARLWPGVAAQIARGPALRPPGRLTALAPTFGMMLTFGLLFAVILPLLFGSHIPIAAATQAYPAATATGGDADGTADATTAPARAVDAPATPSPTAVAQRLHASPTPPPVPTP